MLIDILIILAIGIVAYHGHSIGLVRQMLSAAGFIGGLFIGAALQPHVVNASNDTPSRSLLALSVTLACAITCMSLGEYSGALLKRRFRQIFHLNKIDAVAGGIAGSASLLVSVWLLAPTMMHLPVPGFSQALQKSTIVSLLEDQLPPAPSVISGLNHLINPNGFPDVFAGLDRKPLDDGTPLPDLGNGRLQAAVETARTSVVKLEGRGCGGLVDGSGYVAYTDDRGGFVVTNAHVIAGVDRPTVLDANGRHDATPIWFDADLDIAVLRVRNLAGKPLSGGPNTVARGTTIAVLGYPGGGSFRANGATVLDQFTAVGRDIYGQHRTRRDIYELKADIIPGNSGGPIINADGKVVGVVFAQSTTYNQIGYALSMAAVNNALQQATADQTPVATGACAE